MFIDRASHAKFLARWGASIIPCTLCMWRSMYSTLCVCVKTLMEGIPCTHCMCKDVSNTMHRSFAKGRQKKWARGTRATKLRRLKCHGLAHGLQELVWLASWHTPARRRFHQTLVWLKPNMKPDTDHWNRLRMNRMHHFHNKTNKTNQIMHILFLLELIWWFSINFA